MAVRACWRLVRANSSRSRASAGCPATGSSAESAYRCASGPSAASAAAIRPGSAAAVTSARSSTCGAFASIARSRSNASDSASSRRLAWVQRDRISPSICRRVSSSAADAAYASSSFCRSRKAAVSSPLAYSTASPNGFAASSPNWAAAKPRSSWLVRTASSVATSSSRACVSSSGSGVTGTGCFGRPWPCHSVAPRPAEVRTGCALACRLRYA